MPKQFEAAFKKEIAKLYISGERSAKSLDRKSTRLNSSH